MAFIFAAKNANFYFLLLLANIEPFGVCSVVRIWERSFIVSPAVRTALQTVFLCQI